MTFDSIVRAALALAFTATLSACGLGDSSLPADIGPSSDENIERQRESTPLGQERESTIFDLFTNADDPNTTVEVNKYIWTAALEVLDFLPIEAVDPFSGVIVTGFGTPPGGGRAYRATVYVTDPALDARALNVALATRSGPVDGATTRAIEDAILTRARQLRIRDGDL